MDSTRGARAIRPAELVMAVATIGTSAPLTPAFLGQRSAPTRWRTKVSTHFSGCQCPCTGFPISRASWSGACRSSARASAGSTARRFSPAPVSASGRPRSGGRRANHAAHDLALLPARPRPSSPPVSEPPPARGIYDRVPRPGLLDSPGFLSPRPRGGDSALLPGTPPPRRRVLAPVSPAPEPSVGPVTRPELAEKSRWPGSPGSGTRLRGGARIGTPEFQ